MTPMLFDMADSRRALVAAGVLGNLSPAILRAWAQAEEGIRLPGATWLGTLGWFLMTMLMAAFAGWFVLYVWKERTTRRAFFIGLALPYMLSGFLGDASSIAKLPRARAQERALEPAAPNTGLVDPDFALFRLEAADAETGQLIPDAKTRLIRVKTGDIVATSTLGAYALPRSPAEDYIAVFSAPGYRGERVGPLRLAKAITIRAHLKRSPWWRQIFDGALAALLPVSASPR